MHDHSLQSLLPTPRALPAHSLIWLIAAPSVPSVVGCLQDGRHATLDSPPEYPYLLLCERRYQAVNTFIGWVECRQDKIDVLFSHLRVGLHGNRAKNELELGSAGEFTVLDLLNRWIGKIGSQVFIRG